ncbi:uncharacterized protein PV06_07838 [Exophiala oligosperma]|uniref:Non-homologous end-joining factor 1 n=1 Tax=Exophiala oligosperma TaxID=215243 RepID=A0A0D2AKV3_9EURO|nr:uncharacterized protein PV06_07838 [Exophiala oligosperma]KIW40661.1 hypothetical protein PV06_07838 [Exophiala oligosperma]
MPDSGREGWQELQVPSRRQCPKLFYSLNVEDEHLTLLMTDLISVWESSLDKYDIIGEAARQHTSIDPSVSPDQFEVLLTKITESLKDGENVLSKQEVRNSQILLLTTKIDLPKPLKPLEWTFKLGPRDASEMAERILRPSLHEVAVSQGKIKSLLRTIEDKDHIISRLLERIGSSSIDLSLVFPGITGAARRGAQVTVSDAKRHIPGMASFDEKSWIKQFANDDVYEGADRTGLGNLVRGCEKCFAHSKAEHEDWIRDLSSPAKKEVVESKKTGPPDKSTAKKSVRGESKSGDESTDSDDEFERQSTPPALRSKGRGTSKTAATSTAPEADEKDEERTNKRANLTKKGKLGRRNAAKSFGRADSKSKSPSPDASKVSSPQRRGSDASTSTATATASEDQDEEVKPPSKESDPKPRIGALRSKQPSRKSPSTSPSPSRDASKENVHHRPSPSAHSDDSSDLDLDNSPPPAKTPPRQRHRLGRLGGKSATTTTTSRRGMAATSSSPPQSDLKKSNPTTTTTTTNNNPSGSEPDSESKATAATQTTPRRRLGRIGIRNRQSTQTQSRDSDATDSPSPSPSPSTTRLRSGDVQPQGQTEDKDEPETESEPHRQRQNSTSPAKEETAEERANRRRMELKRSIAANAGAKKKRRF